MPRTSFIFCAIIGAALALSAPAFGQPVQTEAAASRSTTERHIANKAIVVAQETRRERRSRSRQKRESTRGNTGALAGRYGILREKNADVGCLLSLHSNGRAQLGPGCGDHGFVVFDPVRWQASGNKIILRARKGHRITFSPQTDGTWQRDPAVKKALGLKKY